MYSPSEGGASPSFASMETAGVASAAARRRCGIKAERRSKRGDGATLQMAGLAATAETPASPTGGPEGVICAAMRSLGDGGKEDPGEKSRKGVTSATGLAPATFPTAPRSAPPARPSCAPAAAPRGAARVILLPPEAAHAASTHTDASKPGAKAAPPPLARGQWPHLVTAL